MTEQNTEQNNTTITSDVKLREFERECKKWLNTPVTRHELLWIALLASVALPVLTLLWGSLHG